MMSAVLEIASIWINFDHMNENQLPFSCSLKSSPRLISFLICSQGVMEYLVQAEFLEGTCTAVQYRRAE